MIADVNWNIGNNENKIYDIPAHEAFIKEKIKDHPVVIGFNYFIKNHISKVEGASKTYVLCPEMVTSNECICVHSLKDLWVLLRQEKEDVYVLGGRGLFISMLPYIEHMYVTRLSGEYPATASIPAIDENPYKFILSEQSTFRVYDNKVYTFEEYRQLIRNT